MNFPEFKVQRLGFSRPRCFPHQSLFCSEVGFYYVVHTGLELLPQPLTAKQPLCLAFHP